MEKNKIYIGLIIFGLLIASAGVVAYKQNISTTQKETHNLNQVEKTQGTKRQQQNTNTTNTNLPDNVKQALNIAIMDEYKALATYNAVIDKFGQVRPFTNIKKAEEQHIKSLESLYLSYNLDIPKNTIKANAPESIQEACNVGVEAEIENAKLYRENLLHAVKEYPDITAVFENLMSASQQNHLPAFEKCE